MSQANAAQPDDEDSVQIIEPDVQIAQTPAIQVIRVAPAPVVQVHRVQAPQAQVAQAPRVAPVGFLPGKKPTQEPQAESADHRRRLDTEEKIKILDDFHAFCKASGLQNLNRKEQIDEWNKKFPTLLLRGMDFIRWTRLAAEEQMKKSSQPQPAIGPKTQIEVFEENLLKWFKHQRQQGIAITKEMFYDRVAVVTCGFFTPTAHWWRTFCHKAGITTRTATDGREKSNEVRSEVKIFGCRLCVSLSSPGAVAVNIDEGGLSPNNPGQMTLHTGGGEVLIKGSNSKTHITILFATTNLGGKLPLGFIFKGVEGKDVDKRVRAWNQSSQFAAATQNAWIKSSVYVEYVKYAFDKLVLPALGPLETSKKILVHDSCAAHKTAEVANLLKAERIVERCGPANATELWQPNDCGVIAEFKRLYAGVLRKRMAAFCTDEQKIERKSFTNEEICQIANEAWAQVDQHIVLAAWKKALQFAQNIDDMTDEEIEKATLEEDFRGAVNAEVVEQQAQQQPAAAQEALQQPQAPAQEAPQQPQAPAQEAPQQRQPAPENAQVPAIATDKYQASTDETLRFLGVQVPEAAAASKRPREEDQQSPSPVRPTQTQGTQQRYVRMRSVTPQVRHQIGAANIGDKVRIATQSKFGQSRDGKMSAEGTVVEVQKRRGETVLRLRDVQWTAGDKFGPSSARDAKNYPFLRVPAEDTEIVGFDIVDFGAEQEAADDEGEQEETHFLVKH